MKIEERRARLKHLLETRGFVPSGTATVTKTSGQVAENAWLFDIKNILLDPTALEDIATLFWDGEPAEALQIGGLEVSGIPIAAACVMHASDAGKKDVSGFIIRKSRKKSGVMRRIEGPLDKKRPITLVDDIINSGGSIGLQIEALEAEGYHVARVWTIVQFRDSEYYINLKEKGVAVESAFLLDDFQKTLGISSKNLSTPQTPLPIRLKPVWKFAAGHPSLFHVFPKSSPVLDDERVYMGSDDGTMWAINQSDGSVAWSYKIGKHQGHKGIFSSPAHHDGTLYFGGYDGNVYALDAKTGKKKWMNFDADWVGSSPAIAPDLGLLFIGLEFGLWRKRGGIIALDLKTGEKKWEYFEMPCLTHSSPLYIAAHRQVVIGSNDGAAYLFDARNGKLIWKYETGTLSEAEFNSGFSSYDIKESFAYDAERDYLLFGNQAGVLSIVDRKNGKKIEEFHAEFAIRATPLLYKGKVYFSSLDKYLYCVDLATLKEKWRWYGRVRIFGEPTEIDGSIWIGSNSGRVVELDPDSGKERSFFQVSERITNKMIKNAKTGRFFLPTFANELYCLENI
jgi:outer membrane protein assembly factor BamB/orotate phosphoribosyltransferase